MNMKKLLLLISLCSIFYHSLGQNKLLDSLKQELQNHPTLDTSRVKLLIAVSFYSFESPENTKQFAEEALQLATDIDYEKGKGPALSNLSTYYWGKSNHKKALELSFLSLAAYEKAGSLRGIYNCYSNIAGLYVATHDYDKGIEYLNKAESIGKTNAPFVDYGILYQNLGETHFFKKEYEKAKEYYLKSLAIWEKRADIYGQGIAHHDLAKSLYKTGDSDGAFIHFEKALFFSRKVNAPPVVASCLDNLAKIYVEQGAYTKAESALKECRTLLEKTKSKTDLQDLFGTYVSLYEKQKDYRHALEYFKKKTELKDSLFNEQNIRSMAETESQYNSEKKEQEIALLEQQASSQTFLRNTLIGGLLFTLIAAAVIYSLQRSRTRKTKLLLETQQQLNQHLQEADKLKSRFFANISHEFRTPLTLIISPIEEKLALKTLEQKEKISFQSIRRSANRLLELVNQLLELSKLESGFMKLQAQPGNLHSFVMTILSSFDSLADVGQVHYNKEVRTTEATLLFDGDKLEKILNNLLSNAFKFSPKGAKVDVRVMAAEKEKKVELTFEVQNFGAAIATKNLNRIFEPFYQGDNMPVRGVQGTGLGLSLVKELVKLHGGEIHAASSEAKGTVFTVTMVFDKSDATDIANINSSSSSHSLSSQTEVVSVEAQNTEGSEWSVETPTTSANTDNTKETILIVEDNQDVRNLVRQGLEANYTILEAATGKEGGALANENAVDLVVSDVMMPVMSGVELCHLLKNDERTSHIPIILLTARADHESKLEGLRTGADDYLVKPFNMQELQARVFNLIEQRKRLVQKYDKHIVVQPHEITVTPMDERFVQKVIQTVEANLDNTEFTSDKMSEAVGMSRTNLHRKIKAITGHTTSEFIQDFRLRRAATLIEKKADNISQIAYQVGFNDQSYFTKCFKKKFGKVPSEWNGNARHSV
jgi:signal transduction histidine kinase/DNA-binding response OmpR family regulator